MASILRIKKLAPRKLVVNKPTPPAAKAAAVVEAPAIIGTDKGLRDLLGKALFFEHDGFRVAGKALRVEGSKIAVGLAVPNADGLLCVSDTEVLVEASGVEPTGALLAKKRIKHFEAGLSLSLASDRKYVPVYESDEGDTATAEKSDAIPCDYRDVVIEGFASTFVSTTPKDRIGDYILPGAFDRTITEFMKNPVILTNHDNTVEALAGSWEKLGITPRGLAVRGNISNAPGMKDTRFKLVEGHLKGLSIGGIWYYSEDGYGIEEATLYEISLVAVPMNPDALVQTRALTIGDCRKAFQNFWRTNSKLKSA